MLRPSVIIPTQNKAEILPELLSSLERQSFAPAQIEVVVVDDGSADGTGSVVCLRDYLFPLIYERLDSRGEFCPARPRNHGLRRATGDIVIFLDADVVASHGLVAEHLAAHMKKDRPQAVIGYTYGYPLELAERTPDAMRPPPPDRLLEELPHLLARDGGRWQDGREPMYAASRDLADHSAPWQLFWTNNISIPRLLALEMDGFDEQFTGWGVEDLEFGYRLNRRGVPFTLARQAWGIHYPHPITDLQARRSQLERNRRRLIAKHPEPRLELRLWSAEASSRIWQQVETLLAEPPPKASVEPRATKRLIDRLRTEVFAPGPLLWCGFTLEELGDAFQPAAWCQPFTAEAEGGITHTPLPLIGVYTPWDDSTFAGCVVSEYWSLLPPPVLAGVIRELVRVADCVALLQSDSPVGQTSALGTPSEDSLSDAFRALLLPEHHWELMRGNGMAVYLVYRSPWRGKSWQPTTSSAQSLMGPPHPRRLRADRYRAERQWMEALRQYARVIAADRDLEAALEGILDILAKREDWTGVVRAASELLIRKPGHPTALLLQARALSDSRTTGEFGQVGAEDRRPSHVNRSAARSRQGGHEMKLLEQGFGTNGSGPATGIIADAVLRKVDEQRNIDDIARTVLLRMKQLSEHSPVRPEGHTDQANSTEHEMIEEGPAGSAEVSLASPEAEDGPPAVTVSAPEEKQAPPPRWLELDMAPKEAPVSAPMGAHPLVAPLGTRYCPTPWEGRLARKPWEYRITAVIPHLETPEPLRAGVELLRLQTERPYILVIDTGSSESVKAALEALRAEDLEVHYVSAHGYLHSSEAVGVAQDLAFALCRSEYLYCTHADCFLRRRDYLDQLLSLCGPDTPAVGYEMSPRDWLTDQWEGMISHTATLLHMPTMHRLGVTWSFERAHVQFGIPRCTPAWPDTETCLNLVLRATGVQPLLVGKEENYKRHVDANLDHVRSFPGSAIYACDYHVRACAWMDLALREAWQRVSLWRATDLQS